MDGWEAVGFLPISNGSCFFWVERSILLLGMKCFKNVKTRNKDFAENWRANFLSTSLLNFLKPFKKGSSLLTNPENITFNISWVFQFALSSRKLKSATSTTGQPLIHVECETWHIQ